MVNSKAREATTIQDLIYDYKVNLTLLHALLRDRKGFSATETKPIGTAAGSTNSAAGFLRTAGDTMIGPIAFFPDIGIIQVGDDSIDVSKAAQEAYTSRVIVSAVVSTDLATIHGASHAGQILMLQGILTETFTIKHGIGNIRTFDGADIVIVDNQNVWLVFDSIANEWAAVGGAGGGGTGTHISADMVANQTANLAVGNHIEFDRNAPPTGVDGGIVLQTGVGQANGIFELKLGKTYFLSGAANPIKSAATILELAWYDITNATEIGRRIVLDTAGAVFIDGQPKAEIIFTPATDVNVELRIVANVTPANLVGFFAAYTYAHIFEFSGATGAPGAPGAAGSIAWKDPVRAKTTVDVPNLASFSVITDGVTLVEDDRVLLTEQTTASENGIYDVGVVAAQLAPLTRSSDLDVSAELVASIFVAIEEGNINKDRLWQLISNNPLTIGVSTQVWKHFAPGTSGGPDLGGGDDGIDSIGEFVNDGRIAVGAALVKNWEKLTPANLPNSNVNDIIYLPSNSSVIKARLVVVGGSSIANNSAFSDDLGTTWSNGAGPISSNDNYIRMAYDPVGNVLVAISSNSPNAARAVQKSADRGANWSNTAFAGSLSLADVIWSAADSLFVLVDLTAATTNRIWTSPDGQTWTQRTTPAAPTAGGWSKLAFDSINNLYVCKGQSTTDVMTSPDAITWTIGVTNISILSPNRIIHSPGQEKFVMLGQAGLTNVVYFSSDGINWTAVPTLPGTPVSLNGIVYAEDLSLFLIIGRDSTTSPTPSIFWFSNDANTWVRTPKNTFRNAVISPTITKGVAYSREFGIFFGCGYAGSVGSILRTEVEFNDVIG